MSQLHQVGHLIFYLFFYSTIRFGFCELKYADRVEAQNKTKE
jgi:hypothetical protein